MSALSNRLLTCVIEFYKDWINGRDPHDAEYPKWLILISIGLLFFQSIF